MYQPHGIRNEDSKTVHRITIYGPIGDRAVYGDDATEARGTVEALLDLPSSVSTIDVRINSAGGDAFAAVAIANALREQRTRNKRYVDVSIDALAASAATVISSAGSRIKVADNALVMVHNPWVVTWGTANDLRDTAKTLDSVRDSMISIYQWTSKLSALELRQLLDAETWMTARDAVSKGFAHEVTPAADGGAQARACLSLGQGRTLTVPAAFRDRVGHAPDPHGWAQAFRSSGGAR
jgi:ATP-dependent protease ClpP protease subunit